MINRVEYNDLPETIRGIYPRDQIERIDLIASERIVISLTYDTTKDVWIKVNGKWEYQNK